jgi:flagellar protein FliO/FliZ
MEWIFLKMLLSLGAVLALMFGLVFVLKRFVLPGGASADVSVPVQILGRKSLQPKKSVVILKVAERILVVGVSEQGMHMLTELTEEEVQKAESKPVLSSPKGRKGGFAAQLQATLNTMVNRTLEKKNA